MPKEEEGTKYEPFQADGYQFDKKTETYQDIKTGFQVEPLRMRVINILRQKDQLLNIAMAQNVTKEYFMYLCDSLDRNENIIEACAGRTRSGKSVAMLEQGKMIEEYTEIPFEPETHVCFHDAQFMSRVKNAKFKEWYHIDETEESRFQMGASAEEAFNEDFNRICAKKCINHIHIVGDYSTANEKAIYKLITLARDFHKRRTRFLLFSIEAGENLPIGLVDIQLDRVLCKEMREQLGFSCIRCKKYKNCKEFIARYEKLKDVNITRIAEGGSGGVAMERAKERARLARAIADQDDFSVCKNMAQKIAYVRLNYQNLKIKGQTISNRSLTEGEIKEVAAWADYVIRMEQQELESKTAKKNKVDPANEPYKEDKKKAKGRRKDLRL
jgi:hypothetical protein